MAPRFLLPIALITQLTAGCLGDGKKPAGPDASTEEGDAPAEAPPIGESDEASAEVGTEVDPGSDFGGEVDGEEALNVPPHGAVGEGEGEDDRGEGDVGGEGEEVEGDEALNVPPPGPVGEGEGEGEEGEGEEGEGEEGEEGEGEEGEGEEGEGEEGEGDEGEGGEGEGEVGEEGEGEPPERQCRRDDDCEGELLCDDEGGICVQCLRDGDCPRGTLCRASSCELGCRQDGDCPQGTRCSPEAQLCVGCIEDGDCPDGEACRDLACTPRCQGAGDCPDDTVCWPEAGVCVDCIQDGDCALGQVCENLLCVAGCRDDRDCPADGRCTNAGQCAECVADRHCPSVGGVARICDDGACAAGCRDPAQCRIGDVCRAASGSCGPCEQAEECGQGELCDGGVCRQGCGDDLPCGEAAPHCVQGGVCAECIDDGHCAEGHTCEAGECSVSPEAHRIAIWQGVNAAGPLNGAGFQTEALSHAALRQGALTNERYDALILGRQWGRLTVEDARLIGAFVVGGGGIITEYDGVVPFFSGHHATSRFRSTGQLGWFEGEVGSGQQLARGTEIHVIDPRSPVVAGLDSPIASQNATQYFLTIYGDDPNMRTVATYAGDGSANFPAGDWPGIVEARVCDSMLVFLPFDWQDAPGEAQITRLIVNAATVVVGRPDPSLRGPCPDQ